MFKRICINCFHKCTEFQCFSLFSFLVCGRFYSCWLLHFVVFIYLFIHLLFFFFSGVGRGGWEGGGYTPFRKFKNMSEFKYIQHILLLIFACCKLVLTVTQSGRYWCQRCHYFFQMFTRFDIFFASSTKTCSCLVCFKDMVCFKTSNLVGY